MANLTQIDVKEPRISAVETTLAEALVVRAPSIFPRLETQGEVRDVLMKLVSFAQIRLLAMPLRRDLRDMAGSSLRDLGACIRGDDRDHTTAMAALRVIKTVFAYAGEDDLAAAINTGVRTLCQRIKVN